MLCCERDYLCALWALKSFYYYAQTDYPLVIHLQGRVSLRCLRRMTAHFPAARIVLQPEADTIVEKWLKDRGLTRLLTARRENIMFLQLIDYVLIGESSNLLALDSDVLFFRSPAELTPSSSDPLSKTFFQHDFNSSYDVSVVTARRDLGIKLTACLNNGIRLFARESLDLNRCEEYLGSPLLAQKVGSGLIAQTLHALQASETGRAAYLPDTYLISLESCSWLERLTARHYAGSSRHFLTSEGIPWLVQSGLLKTLSH